ncbi:MAG TPA: MarC family protein [Rhizomicrobium sp.]|jgi:multiple antibiotic resistance protein|nr:MarC family protein [Rhizomicrobium sp.]
MFHIFPTALATLFVAVGPVEVASMFLALTAGTTPRHRRLLAFTAAAVATAVLAAFALGGIQLLALIGVGLPAFRTAGGVLLLMVSADLLLAQHSAISSITSTEASEAQSHQTDIAVFPLAIPLTAGPGSMTAIVLLMSKTHGPADVAQVLAALGVIMLTVLASMLLSEPLMRLLRKTGTNVIARVSGVLLAALAMQFIFDGLSTSGLFR